MNRSNMRIWLLLAIVLVLNACSSTEPTVKPDTTMAHQTITQPRTALRQNYYRSAPRSGAFLKPGELEPAVDILAQNLYGVASLAK